MTTWADQVEDELAEGTHSLDGPPQVETEFPSLSAAAKMPPPPKAQPKKKAKGKTMSLTELLQMPSGGGGRAAASLGPMMGAKDEREILMHLPTASRGKVEGAENEERGLGGAFKDYGGDRGPYGGRREDRGPRRGGDDGEGFMPSRADATDDWGATRQFTPSGPGGGFGGGGFRDRAPRGDGPREPREPRPFSQADVVDDWGSQRKFEPSHDDRDRRGGFGGPGGFRDGPRMDGPPRPRAGPMFDRPMSRADEEDQWGRGREFQPNDRPGARGTSGSREPPQGGRQSGGSRGFGFANEGRNPDAEDRWGHRAPPQQEPVAAAQEPAARTERPRVKLAPRSVPLDTPASAAAPAAAATADEAPKRRSNPFGEARPREEVLKEKQSVEPPASPAKSAWAKPAEQAPAQPAEQPQVPEAAAAPAAQDVPAEAPAAAPEVISLESPAERDMKDSIAQAQRELEQLQEDPDADDEDVAEATAQLQALQIKLSELQEERLAAERKAAEAMAEDDGSGWVSAKPVKAKAAAAAGPEVGRGQASGKGEGRGSPTSERKSGGPRQGGFERERPERERQDRERTERPPRKEGDWPARGGSKPVAAGAPGLERKW